MLWSCMPAAALALLRCAPLLLRSPLHLHAEGIVGRLRNIRGRRRT